MVRVGLKMASRRMTIVPGGDFLLRGGGCRAGEDAWGRAGWQSRECSRGRGRGSDRLSSGAKAH
jgi:hypothetical protein